MITSPLEIKRSNKLTFAALGGGTISSAYKTKKEYKTKNGKVKFHLR